MHDFVASSGILLLVTLVMKKTEVLSVSANKRDSSGPLYVFRPVVFPVCFPEEELLSFSQSDWKSDSDSFDPWKGIVEAVVAKIPRNRVLPFVALRLSVNRC